MAEVVVPCSRSVYLITYSHAEIEKVKSCVQFRDMVFDFFHRNGKANVLR